MNFIMGLVSTLPGQWRELVRNNLGQGPAGHAVLSCAAELDKALWSMSFAAPALLSPQQLDCIELLAEEATEGPWVNDAEGCVGKNWPEGGKTTIATCPIALSQNSEQDAAFITATDPLVTKRLLAMARAAIGRVTAVSLTWTQSGPEWFATRPTDKAQYCVNVVHKRFAASIPRDDLLIGHYDTAEEAKLACERHWQKYIIDCVVITTQESEAPAPAIATNAAVRDPRYDPQPGDVHETGELRMVVVARLGNAVFVFCDDGDTDNMTVKAWSDGEDEEDERWMTHDEYLRENRL